VYHSHDYTILQEFKRYFDIGVFYGRETWIKDAFGTANKEGMRFVKSEIRMIAKAGKYWMIPEILIRTALKFAGFKLGYMEKKLSLPIKRKVSMYSNYWK